MQVHNFLGDPRVISFGMRISKRAWEAVNLQRKRICETAGKISFYHII